MSAALKTTATIHHLPNAGEKQLTIEGVMELPEPPIPEDCDLRNFRYMPLDVQRFIDSKFATTVDPASGFFAIQLWAKSWHQLPAGSLPNDDDQLRALSGCGRDTRLWQSVKEGAMYGWVLHSDNRLYHSALTEFVLDAYDKLLINREKGKKGGRPRKDSGNTTDNQQDNQEKAAVNPQLFHGKAVVNQEKGIEEKREEDNSPYSPPELELEAEEEKTATPNGFACVGESFESVVQESFENLWDKMPLRKVSKETASKAWKKICTDKRTGERKKQTPEPAILQAIRDGADAILKIMQEQAEHVAGYESPFHRLHLGTYLNGKRWRDEEMPERLRQMKAGGAA